MIVKILTAIFSLSMITLAYFLIEPSGNRWLVIAGIVLLIVLTGLEDLFATGIRLIHVMWCNWKLERQIRKEEP